MNPFKVWFLSRNSGGHLYNYLKDHNVKLFNNVLVRANMGHQNGFMAAKFAAERQQEQPTLYSQSFAIISFIIKMHVVDY